MYSLQLDRERKFTLALRTALPVVILMILLVVVTLQEQRSVVYNTAILLAGLFISVYFIFFMLFTSTKEKILDDITDTFNRKFFFSFLAKHIDPAKSYLALISIDNIKEINERYGIENGDKILKKFATILDSYFSTLFKPVPIGRVKGGDFLLLLNGKEEQIKEAIKQFLQTYDNYFIDNIELKLFATYEFVNHTEIKKVVDHLYEELYFCKGKCEFDKKSAPLYKKPHNINAFEALIRDLIAQKRLFIFYQPTYNLKEQSFDYVEISVKLIDSDGNFIHPTQFIPLVNRLGLENSFDLALLEKMLEEIEEFALPPLYYSLNISPFSIRNKRFSQKFWSIIKNFSLPAERVVIELFENSVYKDLNYYKAILQNYRNRGLQIAFDNFGACNASLEYIKSIEVDFIHFDKLFTRKIDDMRYKILLEHWLEVVHKLHIKSVIKFLDNTALVQRFSSMDIDYLQGFAIAKPMEAKKLKTFLGE